MTEVERLQQQAVAARQAGRLADAERCCAMICELEPTNAQAHVSLGVCLGMQGRMTEAAAKFRRAIELVPSLHSAHANLARTLLELGDLQAAERECRSALAIEPANAMGLANLSAILNAAGRFQEATDTASAAIAIRSDLPEAFLNLAKALRPLGRSLDAKLALERAIALRPSYSDAQAQLATLLNSMGEATAAATTIESALRLDPNHAELHTVAGLVLQWQGRSAEAIAHHRRAAELNPRDPVAGSHLLYALHDLDQPDPKAVFEEHRAWARRHADPLASLSPSLPSMDTSKRRLKIAYLSQDFRYHSVAHFLRPILQHHDREQFEIVCYSSVAIPDDWTQEFQRMNVLWREVTRLSDAQLAEQIRADGIDIAVDCSGHTSGNRLLALARRPAPVQVSFLGYPNTTGMSAIDYRITDALADPPGDADALHTEKLIRLDPTAWCYAAPADAPLPSENREPGPIRFGSFTTLSKLTSRWIGVWCDALRKVPDSRLLLKTPCTNDQAVRSRLLNAFASAGIDASRVELLRRQPSVADHLAAYNRIDIALDTFPYHGTTTTCEAMYMGVPMVTCAGDTHASRVGVSLLSAVGLPELVAPDERAFVEIAAALAEDATRLRDLRGSLRERMQNSPLMDAAAYVAGLERAYRAMWTACVGSS